MRIPALIAVVLLCAASAPMQDVDGILARADKLVEASKAEVQGGRFSEAAALLEDARMTYLALQESGPAEKQKVAAERLRAANPLARLIHDARAGQAPAPKADGTPSPVPDAAKVVDAEKLIKDLFKDDFAKKTPADRKNLLKLLLDQAAKNQEDRPTLWVLLREALDVAAQLGDVKSAFEAIDATARVFDVDAPALKTAALGSAAKVASAPAEHEALAIASLRLVEDLVRFEQFDAADKSAATALQSARKSNDADLVAAVTARSKEVAEAKGFFQALKGALDARAKNPDDAAANLEVGRFLCFVQGRWEGGLRMLAKGADAALKALAEKELSPAPQPVDRALAADGWFELADKEKSPLRKNHLLQHARGLYEAALPGATGLVKAKVEKRLGELDAAGAGRAVARPEKGGGEVANPKAIEYLRRLVPNLKTHQHVNVNLQEDELLLLALMSAGVPLDDPDVQTLFKAMMARKLEATYIASLQAIILEEIDRVKYQWRILKCAQFLVDNQCTSGRWSYGLPSPTVEQFPQGDATLTAARPQGVKAKPKNRPQVKKMANGSGEGDHSNAAYAAMGLRACHDAGIALPLDVLALAEKSWRAAHKTGLDAGWCYSTHGDHRSYGSMTACGVGSLSIYDYLKGGKGWKSDKDVQDGLAWLGKNFSVRYNPGVYEHANMAVNSPHQLYYYLYALERAGVLTGTESLGVNKWHPEGVKALQATQNTDGSWGAGLVDTCFALLFLSKATRPLDPAGK